MWSNLMILPIGPEYVPPTTAMRVRRAFFRGLLTGITISGFIVKLYVKHLTAEQLADKILEAEQLDPQPRYTVLDSLAGTRRVLSIAETMMRCGVRWTPSDRNRIQGKMEVHRGWAMIRTRKSHAYKYFLPASILLSSLREYHI